VPDIAPVIQNERSVVQQTPRPAGLLRPVATTTIPEPAPQPAFLPHAEEELLTDDEVIRMLRVNRQWLADHRTRIQPIIPHIKLGREIRYLRSDILQMLRSARETRPRWERTEDAA
jgi:hypothetical protein